MVPPIPESGLQECQALNGTTEHDSYPNSIPTTSMVRALTQKPNATTPMKNSRKKYPSDVVDISMPREKVGTHVKSDRYDILGAGMLWKPKEARILTNFIDQPVNIW
jgi:hypothetical protein